MGLAAFCPVGRTRALDIHEVRVGGPANVTTRCLVFAPGLWLGRTLSHSLHQPLELVGLSSLLRGRVQEINGESRLCNETPCQLSAFRGGFGCSGCGTGEIAGV